MNVIELAVALAVAMSDTSVCYTDPAPHTIGTPGECYAIQYHFTGYYTSTWKQLTRWGFVANDDQTVWPGAGGIHIPLDNSGHARFPTPQELIDATSMVPPFSAAHDTATVIVDLTSEWIAAPPYTQDALVAVLKVPPGSPISVGVGTGFLLADKDWSECSYFTQDGGQTWFALVDYDWAWAAEINRQPTSSVPFVPVNWSLVKELYR